MYATLNVLYRVRYYNSFDNFSAKSQTLLEYPFSLSYQETTLTKFPSITIVSFESKIEE